MVAVGKLLNIYDMVEGFLGRSRELEDVIKGC